MSNLTGRSSKSKQKDNLVSNFKREMTKFLKQYKQFTLKYQLSPDYQLINIFDQLEPYEQNLFEIVTVWRPKKSPYQIYWEYCYKKTKSLVINAFVMLNNRIVRANGIYNINLIIKVFQRYNRQMQIKNHFYTFKINPDSGSMNIVFQALDVFQKLQSQVSKPNYIRQVFQQMKDMVMYCSKIIQLVRYFDGHLVSFPYQIFQTPNLKKDSKMKNIPPIEFLESLHACIHQVNPNCPQQFENFGSLSQRIQFQKKFSIPIRQQVIKIIQLLIQDSILYETGQNIVIFKVLQNIFQYSHANSQYNQQERLTKRIRILVDEQKINWKPFAVGGFGFLEMAFVKYELTDYRGRNPKIYQGEITRKSDIKTSKVSRQKTIFQLFKLDSDPHIMPHYIPVQKQYENYIFSKFQPHSSLEKYLKANRITLNLQTIIKFLEHAVKGLLYLKERSIIHLDVKPNNIIISKDLKAKISDFGETMHLQKVIPNSSPAFTVPYTPMQIFQSPPKFSSKADAYAVGVSLYKVIFGTHLWGEILDSQKFKQELKTKKLRQIKLAPQKIKNYGLKEILGPLVHLSIKCVNPCMQQRPSLFYISVILSFCRSYLHSIAQGGYELE